MGGAIRFFQQEKYVLLIVGLILCTANIGGISIYILDEAKNAACAREMWEQNEWIVPTYNYNLRTDKPPLHYYFMGLAYQLLGVSPFAARLFSAVFGVLTTLIIYFYTKKHLNQKTAFLASLGLLSSIHFVLQFHLAVPDPYLIFFMTLSILAFFTGIQEKKSNQLYVGYAAVALAALAKGIVAIGLVGLIMLLYLIASRRLTWQQLGQLRLLRGGLLFLLIAVPWYVAVGYATEGEWLRGFFFEHNFERFSSEMEGHGGFFLLPLLFVIVGMLPFSIFLPQAVVKAWQNSAQPMIRLSLIAAVVITGFFCFSATKLPNYTVPTYPFLAILLAYFTNESILKDTLRSARWNLWIWLVLTLVLVIGGYFAINETGTIAVGQATPLISLGLLPLLLGAILAVWFYYKNQSAAIIFSLAISAMLTTLSIWYVMFPKIDEGNSVQQGVAILEQQDHIAYFIRMNRAFPFNLQRAIPLLETPYEVRDFFNQYPDGYIITTERHLKELPVKLDTILLQKDLFENTTTAILKK